MSMAPHQSNSESGRLLGLGLACITATVFAVMALGVILAGINVIDPDFRWISAHQELVTVVACAVVGTMLCLIGWWAWRKGQREHPRHT